MFQFLYCECAGYTISLLKYRQSIYFFKTIIQSFCIALSQISIHMRERIWVIALFVVNSSYYGWSFLLWFFHRCYMVIGNTCHKMQEGPGKRWKFFSGKFHSAGNESFSPFPIFIQCRTPHNCRSQSELSTKNPINFVSQSESSNTWPMGSRLEWRSLLGSRSNRLGIAYLITQDVYSLTCTTHSSATHSVCIRFESRAR